MIPKEAMMMISPVSASKLYEAALRVLTEPPGGDQMTALSTAISEASADMARGCSSRAYIDEARKQWATDDLEIDPYPCVSPADSGIWVQAWVFVSYFSITQDHQETTEEGS